MEYNYPTDRDLDLAILGARALIALAVLFPVLAVTAPRPDFIDLGGWFGRSGAVTTVFALLAEVLLVRARLSITPPGMGWKGLNEQRKEYLPRFDSHDRWIFVLTIIGTLIWAYGDLPFTWASR